MKEKRPLPLEEVNVPTELAIAFLVREGVTDRQARSALYKWRIWGRIKNHGGPHHGQALWNLAELRAAISLAGTTNRYMAIHHRLARERGTAKTHDCALCGQQAAHWALVEGPPGVATWSEDLDDYQPLCARCHTRHDRGCVLPD